MSSKAFQHGGIEIGVKAVFSVGQVMTATCPSFSIPK
jgi:hypothetical protein